MYISFAPACLASLGCSLIFLLAYLLDSSINSFIDGCEEFEIFPCTVFKKRYHFPIFVPNLLYRYHFSVFVSIPCISTMYSYPSPVSVLFFCIRTDLLYQCYFLVLWYDNDIYHAITWHVTPACYHMTHACYHLTLIWYHLSPAILNTWLVIIIFWESYPAILYYIQWLVSLVLMCSCTPVFLNLPCSCYSRKLIIT